MKNNFLEDFIDKKVKSNGNFKKLKIKFHIMKYLLLKKFVIIEN